MGHVYRCVDFLEESLGMREAACFGHKGTLEEATLGPPVERLEAVGILLFFFVFSVVYFSRVEPFPQKQDVCFNRGTLPT